MIRFNRQTKQLLDKTDQIVKEHAVKFHRKIVEAYPVDTGLARAGWEAPKNTSQYEWTVVNNIDYAGVLWLGRHEVGGKVYGSLQMPRGGTPILQSVVNAMQKKLKGL